MVPGDEAIQPRNDFGNGAVVGCDDLAQILGITSRDDSGELAILS
jgi:hypothetical protein